jgi:hypothetical protein
MAQSEGLELRWPLSKALWESSCGPASLASRMLRVVSHGLVSTAASQAVEAMLAAGGHFSHR